MTSGQLPCVTIARLEPTTAVGEAFIRALTLIFNDNMLTYDQTVKRVMDAFYGAEMAYADKETERDECLAGLRWFWSSAVASRWKAHLFDGWLYSGGDWWGFNETLMSAGAYIEPKHSVEAIRILLGLEPGLRDRVLFQYYRPHLMEAGLNARAAAGHELLLEFCERPDLVSILLYQMDANAAWQATLEDESAYTHVVAAWSQAAHDDYGHARLLKTIELMENRLCMSADLRITLPSTVVAEVHGGVTDSMGRLSVDDPSLFVH
jgi:hypothetical protein